MDLLFRIESIQSEETSQQNTSSSNDSFTFSPLGGLIGRSSECDWVLPDPDRRLSGKHVAISFENNRYQITDLSTNGLFVNNQSEPLGKGSSHTIDAGDRFLMGPYCIVASVPNVVADADIELTEMLSDDNSQHSIAGAPNTDEISFVEHEHLINTSEARLDDILDFPEPLKEAGNEDASQRQENSMSSDVNTSKANSRLAHQSPYVPNTTQTPPANKAASSTQHTKNRTKNRASILNSNDEHLALLQFIRGTGLDDELLSHPDLSELMFDFGALLKRYTGELMKLMGERSSYKNQCRLDMTLVAPEHNNPLKYCVNEVQALREIVISPQRENLSGGHAIESAIEDIRDHFARVEKGYQGTLFSLIDYLSMANKKADDSDIAPNKVQPTQNLSNMPWHYRKRIKQLQQKTALLKDPGYYSDEFFAPRFSYFYQNPELAIHQAGSISSEENNAG